MTNCAGWTCAKSRTMREGDGRADEGVEDVRNPLRGKAQEARKREASGEGWP